MSDRVSRVVGKSRMAVTMAGLGGRMMAERARRPRPTALADVPGSVSALTREWLTRALCPDGSGARVLAYGITSGSSGTTTRRTIELTYNEAGRRLDLPQTVFIKSAATFRSRVVVGLSGGAEVESRFYRLIRPALRVNAPVGYYSAADRRTCRSIQLIEDLKRTRSAVFGDPTSHYVGRASAESIIDNLAVIHGSLWDSPRFNQDLCWVKSSVHVQNGLNTIMPFERRILVGFDRAGDFLPPELRRVRPMVLDAFTRSLSLDRHGPVGLVHTDVHAGNWFITPDHQMGLFDWQAMAKGQGTRDLAYALMSNLTIEDRRSWEDELLARYVEQLAAAGGRPGPVEAVRLSYRQQTWHGLCYWLFTLGAGPMQPAMQREAVSLVNLERMGQAVVDLDSLAILGRDR